MFYNKHCACMYAVLSICFISLCVLMCEESERMGEKREQTFVVNAHNSSADLMVILVVPWYKDDYTTAIFVFFPCRLS